MNINNQYGAGLRTGMLIGAGSFALLMLLLIGLATAGDWRAQTFFGSLNTDRLGGTGSSKSTAGVAFDFNARDIAASVRVWRIAEKLDDDAGISPVSGGSIEASRRFSGPWRAGASVVQTDIQRFTYITLGMAVRDAGIDWLVPVTIESRFGLRARLRAPLSGGWFAQIHYEYVGRQDPDIKISNIGIGAGRSF